MKGNTVKIFETAKTVFEENEYIRFISYIVNNKLNDARLLVDRRLDFLNSISLIRGERAMAQQVADCTQLESLILAEYEVEDAVCL